jgi:hypothetical protein
VVLGDMMGYTVGVIIVMRRVEDFPAIWYFVLDRGCVWVDHFLSCADTGGGWWTGKPPTTNQYKSGFFLKSAGAGCEMHARRETDKDKLYLLSQLTISIPTNFAHLHVLEHLRKLFYL